MNEEETGKSFLVLAVFNVLLLAAVFVIGWRQHHNAGGGWDACTAGNCGELPAGAMGPIVSIDDMLVQLQPYSDDRYVRLSLGLEVDGEGSQVVVVHRTTQIREAILRTFAEHKPGDLQGSEGLAELKKSLMSELRGIVPGKHIRNIYVTDFNVM
jgi:flagellar basal body-associated protein FliL